ncbi:MAG: helix-turn-helix domain-containing protein [Tuberibacillus sp.]
MTYLQFFILHILNAFQGERSASAIYHLLRGKRTSQTIQDGFLFQVHPYFGTLPHLSRQNIMSMINDLIESGLVAQRDADHFSLTEKGSNSMALLSSKCLIPDGLNGWFYGGLGRRFWKRLTQMIQTLSHLQANESRYYPVIRDESTLNWVKRFLVTAGYGRDALADQARTEMEKAMGAIPDFEADLLVSRLSGYKNNGLSIAQLSDITGKSDTEILLVLQSGIHRLVEEIIKDKDLRILREMLEFTGLVGLTDSAKKTYYMLQKGLTISEMAKIRGLKESTIQDHIVEIAFCNPVFSVQPFVSPDSYRAVAEALKKVKAKKLSAIKQLCPDTVDYFHIRLVLAREKMT